MALVGLSPNIWLALGFLVCAGAADMISFIFRSTIWNQTIPDEHAAREREIRAARAVAAEV